MQGVVHYNRFLNHQVNHAAAFSKCGFGATNSPDGKADIHVISGPHYAYKQWIGHKRVLMIDRALWGDPDSVSIGRLKPDGSRKFATGTAPRPKPDYLPWKHRECSCLILADYGQDVSEIKDQATMRFNPVVARKHPAEHKTGISLKSEIAFADVVIGHSGTAIFEAIIMGSPVICTDKNNPCYPVCSGSINDDLYRGDRDKWLHDMSYTQFTLAEIAERYSVGTIKGGNVKISTNQITETIAPAVEPVSLAEMKAHLRVDFSDEDSLISALITASRNYIEKRLHKTLVQKTYRADVSCFYSVFRLPLVPISSITQIQYLTADSPEVLTTLDASTYILIKNTGMLYLADGATYPSVANRHDAVQITYIAGYDPLGSPEDFAGNIPQAIKQAMLLICGDYYENRKSTSMLKVQNLKAVDNLISAFREY